MLVVPVEAVRVVVEAKRVPVVVEVKWVVVGVTAIHGRVEVVVCSWYGQCRCG